MNEPIRWRDDPDAPNDLRDVITHAKPSRRMTPEQFARGSRRLATGVAAASGLFLGLKGTAWAAIVGIGVIAASAVVVNQNQKPTARMQISAPAVAKQADVRIEPAAKPAEPAIEAVTPAELPVASAPAASVKVKETDSRDSLAEEAELIEQARRMVASNPTGALALLDQHQKRFARGKLGMERELLRVDALRRAGRTAEARSLVESLLSRTNGGIYETRLRQLLASLGG
jgi:hypothetical protein